MQTVHQLAADAAPNDDLDTGPARSGKHGKRYAETLEFGSIVGRTRAWKRANGQQRRVLLALAYCAPLGEGITIERAALGKLEWRGQPVVEAATRGAREKAVQRALAYWQRKGLLTVRKEKALCQPGTHGIPKHHNAKLRVVANHYQIAQTITEWVPVADTPWGEEDWRYKLKRGLERIDGITKTDLAVARAILDLTSPVTGCTATQMEIATKGGVSQSAVSKSIKRLLAVHALRREKGAEKQLFPGDYVPLTEERTTVLWEPAVVVQELPDNVIHFPSKRPGINLVRQVLKSSSSSTYREDGNNSVDLVGTRIIPSATASLKRDTTGACDDTHKTTPYCLSSGVPA